MLMFVWQFFVYYGGLKGINLKMTKNRDFWQYLLNASLDFDEIWPKVASYEMLCFGIGQLPGKILNPEIISLIPYNNGISRANYFHAL